MKVLGDTGVAALIDQIKAKPHATMDLVKWSISKYGNAYAQYPYIVVIPGGQFNMASGINIAPSAEALEKLKKYQGMDWTVIVPAAPVATCTVGLHDSGFVVNSTKTCHTVVDDNGTMSVYRWTNVRPNVLRLVSVGTVNFNYISPENQATRSIAIKDPNHFLGDTPYIYLWIYKSDWAQAWEFAGGWPGVPMTLVPGTTDMYEVVIEIPDDVRNQGLIPDIRMLFNNGEFGQQTIDIAMSLDGQTFTITNDVMLANLDDNEPPAENRAPMCMISELPEYLQLMIYKHYGIDPEHFNDD